jgi:hypothetical protein
MAGLNIVDLSPSTTCAALSYFNHTIPDNGTPKKEEPPTEKVALTMLQYTDKNNQTHCTNNQTHCTNNQTHCTRVIHITPLTHTTLSLTRSLSCSLLPLPPHVSLFLYLVLSRAVSIVLQWSWSSWKKDTQTTLVVNLDSGGLDVSLFVHYRSSGAVVVQSGGAEWMSVVQSGRVLQYRDHFIFIRSASRFMGAGAKIHGWSWYVL